MSRADHLKRALSSASMHARSIEVPAFAPTEAATSFRRARAGDGKFVPKIGVLRKEALRLAQPFHDELAQSGIILGAAVPTPNCGSPEKRREAVEEWERTLKITLRACQPPNEIARRIPAPCAPARQTPAEALDAMRARQPPSAYAPLAYLLEKSGFTVHRVFATKGSDLEVQMKKGGQAWLAQ
jgi:hypothetical protein